MLGSSTGCTQPLGITTRAANISEQRKSNDVIDYVTQHT
jgi:hypothetical protein